MVIQNRTSGVLLVAVAAVLFFVTAYVLSTVLLCGLVKNASWCQWWPHFSLSRIIQFIQSSGFWGVGISIGIMVVHSFVPFPAEFVAIANGVIYGAFWGTVITWIGAMLGAFLAFGLSRKIGRNYVQQKLKDTHASRRMEKFTDSHGSKTLLISRFIPVISFNLINYMAGLTRISWWTFTWTTALGILPMTVLMVIMGDRVDMMKWQTWTPLLIAGVVWWLFRYVQKKRDTSTNRDISVIHRDS
jgi:uncharacterized membrane protein YdjX (TVP38/TMEM64 family)